MPGLVLDDGSWKDMDVPSSTTIGRSGDNMIQPESQSVSKKHATITVGIDHRGKQICTVEDHGSRNGTFWGPSPYDREQQRVDKTQIIPYGTFLKFGNSNTYFNYLEEKPREAPIAYDPLSNPSLKREDTQESELLVDGENIESSALVPFVPPRSASPVELGVLNTSGDGSNAGSLRASGGGIMAPAAATMAPVLTNSNNMMISIQYPHGKENNPVSIHIDPKGNGPPTQTSFSQHHSNRSSGHYSDADHVNGHRPRRSDERPLRGTRQRERSGRESREWEDAGSLDSPPPGEIGRGVQRYNSQALSSRGAPDDMGYADEDDDEDIPLPLAETGLRNAAPHDGGEMRGSRSRGKRSAGPSPPISPRSGVDLDDFRHHHPHHDGGGGHSSHGHSHNPFPLSPIKGSFGFPYPGKTDFHEKSNPLLVRRAWPDIAVVPITSLTSTVSHDLNADQLYEGYDEKSPQPTVEDFSNDLPPYVRSEAVADRFQDPEDTVCGKLGGAIAELNDLLKQAIVGSQVKSPQQSQSAGATTPDPVADAITAELDSALQTLVNDILVRSINTVQSLLRHNLISAFAEADRSRECHNDVLALLTNACGRLERLLAFSNKKGFGKSENQKYAKKARSSERHAVVAYSLHYSVLSELDIANCLLFSATQEAVAEEELKANPLGKGKGKQTSSSSPDREDGGKVRGSHDTGGSIQLELEELRRLKSKANRKGGSAALAAQIRELEEKAVSHAGKGVVAVDGSLDFGPLFMPAGGAGEQTQRYDSMELKRLREQEDAEGHKYQRFARALFIATNNVRRFWNYAFRRWANVVNDMKRDYTNKMRHFAYCLKDRGHNFLRNAFRKLAKHAHVEREQQRVDQVRAELRYEMCGMQQKIHELSSQNTLAASLAAERALNRELTDLNLELRTSITELDAKLLEVVSVEPAERKELVRDVLFGREDALSMARREAKALRDELQELYDLSIRLPEGPRKNIMESAPVPPSFKRPKDPKAEPLPETIDKYDKRLRDTAPLTDGRQNTRPLALKEQALPETSAGLASKKKFLPHRGDLSVDNPMRPLVKNHNKELAPVQGRFLDDDNRRLINGLSRKDATIIIAKEVRRLTDSLRKTAFERNRMQKRLTHDATKHMQQTLAIEALQKRITDRERSLTQLRKLLKEKRFVGDKGLVELTIALEDSGVGNSAILMEPSSLDDPTVDYSNVPPLEPFRFGPPGDPEKPNDLQNQIRPVDVTRQRESYQDAVDDALGIVDPAKLAAEEELKRQILEEAGARSEKAFPMPGASG